MVFHQKRGERRKGLANRRGDRCIGMDVVGPSGVSTPGKPAALGGGCMAGLVEGLAKKGHWLGGEQPCEWCWVAEEH